MLTAPTRRKPSTISLSQKALLLSVSCIASFVTGCGSHRRPKFRFTDAAYAHPLTPTEAISTGAPTDAPDIDSGTGSVPPQLSLIRTVPLKPHVAAPPVSPPTR